NIHSTVGSVYQSDEQFYCRVDSPLRQFPSRLSVPRDSRSRRPPLTGRCLPRPVPQPGSRRLAVSKLRVDANCPLGVVDSATGRHAAPNKDTLCDTQRPLVDCSRAHHLSSSSCRGC
ncbi:hypothetical protein LSAT2_005418, partial [Lamellibrachia satsuma]